MDRALKTLSFLGFWMPITWKNTYRGRLYNLARLFIIPMPIIVVIGQIMYILVVAEDLDGMMVTLYMLPSSICNCCKGFNIMMKQRELIELRRKLSSKYALPMNDQETDIHNRHEDTIHLIYSAYFWISWLMILSGTASALLGMATVPIEAWFPYDHTSSFFIHSISFLQNFIGGVCIANLFLCSDSIFNGFLVNIIRQLDLLAYRLINLAEYSVKDAGKILNEEARVNKEKALLRQCIEHHVVIYEIADKFVSSLRIFIWAQWISSSTVISICVYTVTKDLSDRDIFNTDFCLKISNLTALLLQLFWLCWFSEQIFNKSQELGETVLNSDWTNLHVKSIRAILMIAIRSTRPIIISSSQFCTFSLEAFKALLKVSYTAINILRDSST